ncbi:MAG: large conductance mechanosensitive channel protein MscL [Oculatellaceae cyanobacterium Prado106]|jgi:large conductance mechanosensitive channel|nr:large conductance mechanosensitive channel protein MscL [Oculatellaceae cyanobacterium Prado106]
MARQATGFFSDFKAFLSQGNVIDLATAVIIGGAFGKIIESLVTDVITPAILAPTMAALGVDQLQNLVVGNGIKIGLFLAAVINFVVIAFCIFVMLRILLKFKRPEVVEEAAPDPAVLAQERMTHAMERLTQVMESR